MSAVHTRTIREARDQYFLDNALGPDGGYAERWVKLKLGPVPFAFPNTESRRRAVRFHDIHHLVTEYGTDLVGEAEIGAWELASGCRHHRAAWVLNLAVVYGGLFLAPRRVFRAFVRGRHSLNFYADAYDDALLSQTVESARQRLRLDREAPAASLIDVSAFLLCALAALTVGIAPAALLIFSLVR